MALQAVGHFIEVADESAQRRRLRRKIRGSFPRIIRLNTYKGGFDQESVRLRRRRDYATNRAVYINTFFHDARAAPTSSGAESCGVPRVIPKRLKLFPCFLSFFRQFGSKEELSLVPGSWRRLRPASKAGRLMLGRPWQKDRGSNKQQYGRGNQRCHALYDKAASRRLLRLLQDPLAPQFVQF
ncbi:MAG: hypothetical protein NTZ09_17310 [Candidatus Hydrogenedentes bacterium]|nr:hypothetical protein [Candidatus Hydrogenedentota bacterium]